MTQPHPRERPADAPSVERTTPKRLVSLFLVLGSVFFGLAILDRAMTFVAGFSSILLIVLLAWLLSFLVAQAVDAIQRRSGFGRGVAIGLVYLIVVSVVGLVVFATIQIGVRDTTDILHRGDEVTARIHPAV